ncbi:MAG: adenosine deaminase [Nannocystaceae bacterium]
MSTSPSDLDPTLERLIRRLPKVELHLHLEGSIQPERAVELARLRGVSLPGAEAGAAGLRRSYRFPSFRQFVQLYVSISACLEEPEDFMVITVDLARALAAQNVRHAEVTVTPLTHVRRGVPAEVIAAGLAEGRRRAREEHGVSIGWVFDIVRSCVDHGRPTLEFALAERERGAVGLGLSGPEEPRWPYEPFVALFAEARAEGLRALPHAGELRGPESVRQAIELLGASRIGHGITCLQDQELVALLRDRPVPLEVCPSSNVGIGLFPSLAEHPLPKLLAAGVPLSLASDDPPMFDTDLVREFLRCAAAFSWGPRQVIELAAAAVEHSALEEDAKARLVAEQAQVAAACLAGR